MSILWLLFAIVVLGVAWYAALKLQDILIARKSRRAVFWPWALVTVALLYVIIVLALFA